MASSWPGPVLIILGVIAAVALAAVPALVSGAPVPTADGQLRDGTRFRVADSQLFLVDRTGRWSLAPDGAYETRDGKRLVVQRGRIVPDAALTRPSDPPGATGPPRAGLGPSGGTALPQGTAPGGPSVPGPKTVSTPPLTMTGVGTGPEGRQIVATGELRMTGVGVGASQESPGISTGELTMTGIGQ